MAKQKVEKLGFFQRIKKWFRGVRLELKKVTWPTKKEMVNFTLVVISISLLLAIFIGAFDTIFGEVFIKWL